MRQKDDLISRQAAIMETWREPRYTDPLNVLTEIRDRLRSLPSEQPERKKGKWRHYEGYLTCSECGTEYDDDIMTHCGDDVPKFCPDCGADMREVTT